MKCRLGLTDHQSSALGFFWVFFRDIERLKVLFLLSLTEGRVCDSDGEIRNVLVSKCTFYLGCYV